MKPLPPHEQTLLDLAHQVLAESHQLMLPHHLNSIGPRLETFDEMLIHDVNATGINRGRFRTNIFLLTRKGQRPSLTRQQTHEDTVIIDLSDQPEDLMTMRRFLLTTEQNRTWHHAPWIVINMLKKKYPRNE
ncbi:MAG: hypothetical protein J5543_02920 [Bacteroidales bacterium]|nr:hypothetical protein [Bacteroidales bacterium]